MRSGMGMRMNIQNHIQITAKANRKKPVMTAKRIPHGFFRPDAP